MLGCCLCCGGVVAWGQWRGGNWMKRKGGYWFPPITPSRPLLQTWLFSVCPGPSWPLFVCYTGKCGGLFCFVMCFILFFSFPHDQVWFDSSAVDNGLKHSSLLPCCQSLKDLLCPGVLHVRQIHPAQTGKTPSSFSLLVCLLWPFITTDLLMLC